MNFDDTLENDHLNMLTTNEFGVSCLNTRNSQEFSIIKTEAFIQIDGEGLPITTEKPMFNTSLKFKDANDNLIDIDIKQDDILAIESKNYLVFDIRKDGIGGIDIYLKDYNV